MNGLNKIAEQFTLNIAATSGYFSPQRVNQSAKTSDISFEDIFALKAFIDKANYKEEYHFYNKNY